MLDVTLSIRDLPRSCRPGLVTRGPSWVVVALDTKATLFEASLLCIAELTPPELDYLRAGFGEPPIGQPADPFWFSEAPVNLAFVPDHLLTARSRRVKHAQRREILGA